MFWSVKTMLAFMTLSTVTVFTTINLHYNQLTSLLHPSFNIKNNIGLVNINVKDDFFKNNRHLFFFEIKTNHYLLCIDKAYCEQFKVANYVNTFTWNYLDLIFLKPSKFYNFLYILN